VRPARWVIPRVSRRRAITLAFALLALWGSFGIFIFFNDPPKS
jgi:hypothetical protein